MNDKTMAARLIVAWGLNDKRTELERDVDDVNPITAMVNSLIDITLWALRELAQERQTTVEALLMDAVDDG